MSEMSDIKSVPRRYGKSIDFKKMNRTGNWRKSIAAEQKAAAIRLLDYLDYVDQCPICKSSYNEHYINIYGYSYVECCKCSHLYLQMPPKPFEINKLYSGEKEERCLQSLVYVDEEVFNERVAQIAKPKMEYISSFISEKGLWVDIGCGTGELLVAAQQFGWSVKGYEADPEEVSFGRSKGLNIVNTYLKAENIACSLENAKVVSCINMLEHLRDPLEFIIKITQYLPEGSYMAIEVPRHPSLSSFINLLFPELSYRHIYPPDHLHIFSEQSIELLLKLTDLEPIGVWSFGQDFSDYLLCSAAQAGINDECRILNKLLESSTGIQKEIDRAGLSDALLLVARKTGSIS